VKTPESMSIDVMRRLARASNDLKWRAWRSACTRGAFYLQNRKRSSLARLEEATTSRSSFGPIRRLADEVKWICSTVATGGCFLADLDDAGGCAGSSSDQQGGAYDRAGRGGRGGRGDQALAGASPSRRKSDTIWTAPKRRWTSGRTPREQETDLEGDAAAAAAARQLLRGTRGMDVRRRRRVAGVVSGRPQPRRDEGRADNRGPMADDRGHDE